MPCLDNLWEKCTWDFEFIVPKTLEDASGEGDGDNEDSTITPTIVVCSGELVEKVRSLIISDCTIIALMCF